MKLNDVARFLEKNLIKNGIIVHRYDAHSTNSIYLKLDWGALNSIRISDHNGKKHLSYKYNVIKDTQVGNWKKEGKFWRYYCSTSENSLYELVDIIMKDKQYKKCFNDYDKLVKSFKDDKDNQVGFWERAWEVNDDTIRN